MLLVEKNSLYMCYETCPMTPTMSTISKIRELKERAIYKLTLRYGRPFVVFLNTPRLAGAIGSLPENGNKQIPASVQQLTRAIRSDGVSLEDITRYAKLADSMQSMRMDSDELKGLLRAGRAGSGQTWGQTLAAAVGLGGPPAGSGDPIENIDTLRAQVQGLKNDLRACETADNREQLQQAMQKLLECDKLVTQLSQRIEDLNKKLQEERAKNERLTRQLSAEGQAKERLEGLRRAAEQQRLEAERREAAERARSNGRITNGPPPQDTQSDDEEETKDDECGALPVGFAAATAVQNDVTTKEIFQFAERARYEPDMILVYSNKDEGRTRGFSINYKIYCPVVSVSNDDEITIDKRGVPTTLKIDSEIMKEDIFVNEGAFAVFLQKARASSRRGRRPDTGRKADAQKRIDRPTGRQDTIRLEDGRRPADRQGKKKSDGVVQRGFDFDRVGSVTVKDDEEEIKEDEAAVDRFANIKVRDNRSDSAPDSDDEDEDMDLPTAYYFAEADLPKIKELVRLSDIDIEMSRDDRLEKLYNYEKAGNQVWVLSSANFYKPVGGLKFPERTSKNKFPKNEKKPIRADVNDTYTGTGTVPVKLMLRDGAEIQDTYQRIVVEVGKWQQTSATASAPAAAKPKPAAKKKPVKKKPVKKKPVKKKPPSANKSDVWEPVLYKDIKLSDKIRRKTDKVERQVERKGKDKKVLLDNTKRQTTIKDGEWERKSSLMDRIEDFEGIDGVVPALPSIRIPERHEM